MNKKNNLISEEEQLEKIIEDLENLSTILEKENNLDSLYFYNEKFYEKFSFILKKINYVDIRHSILQKDVSGKIKLDNGKPILENFSIQDL